MMKSASLKFQKADVDISWVTGSSGIRELSINVRGAGPNSYPGTASLLTHEVELLLDTLKVLAFSKNENG